MRLLSKDTDYAMRAILYLARRPAEWVSSRRISKEEGIPLQFLRRTLLRLKQEGIIDAREGVSGGVRLKTNARSITLAQIIRTFQGEIKISQCMLRKRKCPNRSKCPLRKEILKAEQMLRKKFERINIASLLKEVRK
ncbi:MAG: RrF2 family transcriptional regulator [bacterium]